MSRRTVVPWFGGPGRQLSGELSRADALGGTLHDGDGGTVGRKEIFVEIM
jgi:hypothetical protein